MVTGDKAKQPRKVWDNPEAARLIEAASAETDHGKRQAIFDQLHRLFLADAPSIPLYNGLDIGAFRSDIKGYRPWAVKKPRAWEVERSGSARRAASRRAAQPANNSAATKSTKARILGDSCRLDGHST